MKNQLVFPPDTCGFLLAPTIAVLPAAMPISDELDAY